MWGEGLGGRVGGSGLGMDSDGRAVVCGLYSWDVESYALLATDGSEMRMSDVELNRHERREQAHDARRPCTCS